jgi:hypothetical protein
MTHSLISILSSPLPFAIFWKSLFETTVIAVPENCKEINVGDRVLEVNGVQGFNFQSAESANDLFDTLCLVYIPKEELDKKPKDDESAASEESLQRRKGRRTMFEEEARRAGAQRQSSRKLGETLKKQQEEEEEEEDFRRAEVEIRRMGRMDRERQKNQKSPSPPPPPPASRSSIQVEKNIGSFSPTPTRGWSKVNANHKSNGWRDRCSVANWKWNALWVHHSRTK